MSAKLSGEFYPSGMNHERSISQDSLWLQLIPRQLIMTNLTRRVDNVADAENTKETPLTFLMPMTYMFAVEHDWNELTTVASATRDLYTKYQDALKQAGRGFTTGDKADNPILYSNTRRRSVRISLQFSVYSDTYKDVYLPCQKLIEQSCPSMVKNQTEFKFPYIFSLQTYTGNNKPVDIISIKSVGIQTIQPTYDGPWIDGYPSKAQLDVTFIDLNPLYRGTLVHDRQKKITTRMSGG